MPSFIDRYEAAGLHHNPFIARPIDDTPAATFVSRGLADPPPPGSRTLVQVIGPSGFGKTTHVDHWRSVTPGPYHYIPRGPYADRWREPPIGDVVYGDEIDRMPIVLRSRWFRRLAASGSTLVIGTHLDLENLGRRAGFDVVTHRLVRLDRPTLEKIIDLRLQSVAVDERERPRFSSEELDMIMAESGGVPEEADVICHRLLADRVW